MRIEFVKRLGKTVGRVYDFGGFALKGAITAGFVAVAVSTVYEGTLVPQEGTSAIEQFLLENSSPKKEKVKPAKKQQVPVVAKKMSVVKLKVAKTCHQYDSLVKKYFGEKKFFLRKAHMHQESSCDSLARGNDGEHGLFQLKPSTCREVGVTGNLFDPETNIKCAALYLARLCSHYGYCKEASQMVAYNVGPIRARSIVDFEGHVYPTKIYSHMGS